MAGSDSPVEVTMEEAAPDSTDEMGMSPLAQVAQVVAALLGENPEVFARADGPRITMCSAGVRVVLTAVSVSADVEDVLADP